MVTGAVLPSPKLVPRRLRDGDAVETLDAILAELNRQFMKGHMHLFSI